MPHWTFRTDMNLIINTTVSTHNCLWYINLWNNVLQLLSHLPYYRHCSIFEYSLKESIILSLKSKSYKHTSFGMLSLQRSRWSPVPVITWKTEALISSKIVSNCSLLFKLHLHTCWPPPSVSFSSNTFRSQPEHLHKCC